MNQQRICFISTHHSPLSYPNNPNIIYQNTIFKMFAGVIKNKIVDLTEVNDTTILAENIMYFQMG